MFKKIVLISLYDQHAFGLRSLHAALKQNGIRSSCIFYKYFAFKMAPSGKKELGLLIELLKSIPVDIAGISVPSSFLAEAKKITLEIKKHLGIPVAWGGIHPTLRPLECVEVADFVFCGESENSLSEFIRKGPSEDICGLCFRQAGKIINGRPPEVIKGNDILPITDFSDNDKYYIEEENIFYADPVYSRKLFSSAWRSAYRTMSSRGCPFNCYYCGNQALKSTYKDNNYTLRRRKVDSIINELNQAKRILGAKSIIFMDECFATDRSWLSEFCSAYKNEICLPFHCEMHPDLIEENSLSELCAAGLSSTSLGVQSGSERIRKNYFNRFTDNQALIQKAGLIRKFGINLHLEIITDNPYENAFDKQEGINLLLNMPRPLKLNVFSLNFFPETKITEMALRDGLISKKDIEGESNKGMSRFLLKSPFDAKDKFLNYIYYLISDLYSASANTPGLRGVFSEKVILSISRSLFFRRYPYILAALITIADKAKIINKIKSRAPKDPLLFFRIFLLSSILPFMIYILKPKAIFKMIKSKEGVAVDKKKISRIIAYVNSILRLPPYKKIKNICYVRSALLFYFLREAGIKDMKINFGISNKGAGLIGHSWLTLKDKPYLEELQVCNDFAFIYSFPDELQEK